MRASEGTCASAPPQPPVRMVSVRPVLNGGCSSSTTWSTLALEDLMKSARANRCASISEVCNNSVGGHPPDASGMCARMAARCAQRIVGLGVLSPRTEVYHFERCRQTACPVYVGGPHIAWPGTGRRRSARGGRSWARAHTTCRGGAAGRSAIAPTSLNRLCSTRALPKDLESQLISRPSPILSHM